MYSLMRVSQLLFRFRLPVMWLWRAAHAVYTSKIVSLWNNHNEPVFDSGGLAFLRAAPIPSCWHNLLHLFSTIFHFSSFHRLIVRGWGLRIDSVLTLSQPCTANSFLIIIITIIIYFCLLFFLLPLRVGCAGLGSSYWLSVFTLFQPCTANWLLLLIINIMLSKFEDEFPAHSHPIAVIKTNNRQWLSFGRQNLLTIEFAAFMLVV